MSNTICAEDEQKLCNRWGMKSSKDESLCLVAEPLKENEKYLQI